MTETPLELRARRLARRLGLRAHRSQEWIGTPANQGQFQLRDPRGNRIVAGRSFELTGEDVIAFCEARARNA
jgi:hypothetical protein